MISTSYTHTEAIELIKPLLYYNENLWEIHFAHLSRNISNRFGRNIARKTKRITLAVDESSMQENISYLEKKNELDSL